MAPRGLREALAGGLSDALRTQRALTLSARSVVRGARAKAVKVTIEPLHEPAALRGTVMIAFADVATSRGDKAPGKRPTGLAARCARCEEELRGTLEELRAVREEAQTTHEELKSANEELQSTNEELQSTNEELTTSKEEMQSMNEELQTLNSQLQAKLEDLSRTSSDMKNLLDSTGIAVLFLDEALNVRRYTPQAATLIKLIPGDVGRPLANLASDGVSVARRRCARGAAHAGL